MLCYNHSAFSRLKLQHASRGLTHAHAWSIDRMHAALVQFSNAHVLSLPGMPGPCRNDKQKLHEEQHAHTVTRTPSAIQQIAHASHLAYVCMPIHGDARRRQTGI